MADCQTLIITGEHIYEHKVLWINYTSYDLHHKQDIINPQTSSDVMMFTPKDKHEAHPYWYARVIGIYHVLVHDKNNSNNANVSKQIDFLWVQWYGFDREYRSGFRTKQLHQVGFLNAEEGGTFGFIDPNDVLCSVHLLLTFVLDTTNVFLEGPSITRCLDEGDEDYERYYVNLYVYLLPHLQIDMLTMPF